MREELVQNLMDEFAEATGITGIAKPRRYLWTDAFAVCNFLGLAHSTGKVRYFMLAKELIDQVHTVLGRHRDDDPRHGWISGLPEEEGEQHPTIGGLRIGKIKNERGPHEPMNAQLEWDRDGQYFHYLSKWMHALYRMGQETSEHRYPFWAAELAITAQRAFTFKPNPRGPSRMVWKMSIDLSRPLVASMGQHDALDGFINCLEMQSSNEMSEKIQSQLVLAMAEFTEINEHSNWKTDDPLGIGGLLEDATRLAILIYRQGVDQHQLLYRLMLEAEDSLDAFCGSTMLHQSVEYRLAFRELGLALGLNGIYRIREIVKSDSHMTELSRRILRYHPVVETIEEFWSDATNRTHRNWINHQDINAVMLATSLSPDGYFQM